MSAPPPPVRFGSPAVVALLAGLLAACGPDGEGSSPRGHGPPTATRRPDKASVYGDARLVPTRAGELARRELALAGQIARLIDARADQTGASEVDVQLAAPPRVTVSLRVGATDDAAAGLRDDVDRLVRGVLPTAEVTLTTRGTASPTAPAGSERGGVPWPLVLALLGFGLSAGVFAERAAARGVLRLKRNGHR